MTPPKYPFLFCLLEELGRFLVDIVIADNPYLFLSGLRPTGSTVNPVDMCMSKLIRMQVKVGSVLDTATIDRFEIPDAFPPIAAEFPVGHPDPILFSVLPGSSGQVIHYQLDASRRLSLPEMIEYTAPAAIEFLSPEGSTVEAVEIVDA